MASSKKSLKEQEQIAEGIIEKILQKIVMGRAEKVIALLGDNPELKKSVEIINREKEQLEKYLKKHNLKRMKVV